MSDIYFFDTSAFFEILRGNPDYKKYINAQALTTIFNIAELNYCLKKERDKKAADAISEGYWPYVVEVGLDDLKKAMDLKIKNKKLSIPDVIGYTIARRYNVKFLTGDEGFRNMPHAQFVK